MSGFLYTALTSAVCFSCADCCETQGFTIETGSPCREVSRAVNVEPAGAAQGLMLPTGRDSLRQHCEPIGGLIRTTGLQGIVKRLESKAKTQGALYTAWGYTCAAFDLSKDILGLWALTDPSLSERTRADLLFASTVCYMAAGVANFMFMSADKALTAWYNHTDHTQSLANQNKPEDLGSDKLIRYASICCATALACSSVLDYTLSYFPDETSTARFYIGITDFSLMAFDPLLGIGCKLYKLAQKLKRRNFTSKSGEASETAAGVSDGIQVPDILKKLIKLQAPLTRKKQADSWADSYYLSTSVEIMQSTMFAGAALYLLAYFSMSDPDVDARIPYALWMAGDGLGVLFKTTSHIRWRFLRGKRGNEPFVYTRSTTAGNLIGDSRRGCAGICAVSWPCNAWQDWCGHIKSVKILNSG